MTPVPHRKRVRHDSSSPKFRRVDIATVAYSVWAMDDRTSLVTMYIGRIVTDLQAIGLFLNLIESIIE